MRMMVFGFLLLLNTFQAFGQARILFVGNSLTYTHNLPDLVSSLGDIHGKNIKTSCICYPNYGLEDHVLDGQVKQEILTGNYTHVLFQQGPSSQAYGKVSLLQYGDSLSTWAKSTGAQPYYLMVWTSLQWAHTWPDVIKNHAYAAKINHVGIVPIGRYWKTYLDEYETIELYDTDHFHPSKLGSQFAALIIYQTLFENPDSDAVAKDFHLSKKQLNKILSIIND